jgi:hypothetical protein
VSSPFAVTLQPNAWDTRTKPFTLGDRVWKLAVELVETQGYRTNTFSGLSRRDVPVFREKLRAAVEQESLKDGDRRALDGLLGFLAGAGVGGFGLSRGFKSWRG